MERIYIIERKEIIKFFSIEIQEIELKSYSPLCQKGKLTVPDINL
jgi:hypothetical protein